MEDLHNGLAALILIVAVFAGLFIGLAMKGDVEVVETEVVVIEERLVEVEATCPTIVIPEIENADNALLNEFLENEFALEYDEIEVEAETYATEELEDHNYRLIVDYLKDLLAMEGLVLDEDSVDVDVDDVEVKVTKLGLEEDEDKSAIVTFELEVEYELEEGVRDEFEKDLIVVYNVEFDEGDFSDEDVELVLIN